MSKYSEFEPPEQIADFVFRIWAYQSNEVEPRLTVVPDGRAELIFHLGQPYFEEGADDPQPEVLFAGQLTRPLKLIPDAPTDILAVRFHPDGARHFLRQDVSIASDKRINMLVGAHAIPRCLLSDLASRSLPNERVGILSQFISDRVGERRPDQLVRQSVEAIMNGKHIDRPEGITARQFQRRFRREVGVGERMFKSIRRFRSVFDRISNDADEAWIHRALETGYFDQPQLARDFQRFLGVSATTWIRDATGLGLALSSAEN